MSIVKKRDAAELAELEEQNLEPGIEDGDKPNSHQNINYPDDPPLGPKPLAREFNHLTGRFADEDEEERAKIIKEGRLGKPPEASGEQLPAAPQKPLLPGQLPGQQPQQNPMFAAREKEAKDREAKEAKEKEEREKNSSKK